MRIVATSDLHGSLPEIQECDLLLLGGDLCPDFIQSRATGEVKNNGEFRQANWLSDTFKPWLEQVPAKNIVGIAGNHDFVFQFTNLFPKDLPWTYLRDSMAVIDGIRIWGTPWVPNLPFWAFFATSVRLGMAYESIPDCDILLSHGPARDLLDLAPARPRYGQTEPTNVGTVAAREAIERLQPAAFVCGHIHEGYGTDQLGDTAIYNVAYMDGDYNPSNPPMVIDL